jgi:hypothetical protein
MAVVLVHVHSIDEQGDPWERKDALVGEEIDSKTLLGFFNSWALENTQTGALPPHDNHVLLSGDDFVGNNLGLAAVPGMCQPDRSGSVSQAGEDDARTALVVAHELGHNLNFHHDSDGNDCDGSSFIMGAVLGQTPPEAFSPCSATYLDEWLADFYPEQACLENLPAVAQCSFYAHFYCSFLA